MSSFQIVSKSDADEVLKANQAYLAAAWGDMARDWSAADWSGSQLFEDVIFNQSVRRIVCQRLRYAVRNNIYLDGLVGKFPEAVGSALLRSRTSSEPYNKQVDAAWTAYAKDCGADGSSFRNMQLMKLAELLVGGEYFQLELPSGKVQVIPTENCGNPAGYLCESGYAINNGILRDNLGNPVRYFFGTLGTYGGLTFDEEAVKGVDAKYVTHVYFRDRVSMGRGITKLISALPVAQLLFQITEGKTKQILDANSISGFIRKQNAANGLDEMAKQQQATINATNGTSDAVPTAVVSGNAVVRMQNGTFIGLEPGEDIVSLINTYQAADYNQLIMLMLHAISSPVGLPVELWFSGLGDVNYSGFKGLGTQWDGRRKSIIAMIEDEDLEPHFLWWIAREREEGRIGPNPDGDDMKHAWVWRATAVLDEEKKTKAAAARIEIGLTSLADEWEEEGYFEDEVLDRRINSWQKLCVAAGKPITAPPMEFLMFNKIPELGAVAATVSAVSTDSKPGAQKEAAVAGDVQSAALNGAQIASLLELMIKTSTGEISKDAAKAAAKLSFPLASDAAISSVFDSIEIKPVTPAAP
jgi:capsid protein